MKIGIVTQPLKANYGGFLQAWALQEQLRKMGHTPMTVDYLYGGTHWYILIRSWIKTLLLLCVGKRRPFAKSSPAAERLEMFDKFVRKNMSLTRRVHNYKSSLISEYGFEAVITGSDQVWRPIYNSFLQDMFLRFVKESDVKKITYAASFGVDHWEFTTKQTKVCSHLAKKFDAISVRENSGIRLCKDYLGVEAIEVLDPTLMHTHEDYEKLCLDIPKATEHFLASYVLDITLGKQTFIENFAKQQGLKVRIFSAHNDATLCIEEWLAIFRDADYVVTDSFHGTVFSILFHKPFLSLVNQDRGASRFYSLLSKFGVENRLISSLSQTIPSEDINWKNVDVKLDTLRVQSSEFLTNELGK